MKTAKCKVCGRVLKSKESIKRGAGLSCAVHTFEHMPRTHQLLEMQMYAKERLEALKRKAEKKSRKKIEVVNPPRIVRTHFGPKPRVKEHWER